MKNYNLPLTEKEFQALEILVGRELGDNQTVPPMSKIEKEFEVRSLREKLAKLQRDNEN